MFKYIAFGLATAAALSCVAPSAWAAEKIYLKNGTQVKGKIVKESDELFVVEAAGAERKVFKADIEQFPLPSPAIAFTSSLLMPGAGHVYADQPGSLQRAGLFLGLAAIGGGVGYLAGASDPNSLPLSIGLGIGIPTLLGAFDAWSLANQASEKRKFKIEYTEY